MMDATAGRTEPSAEHRKDLVDIVVNGVEHSIHRGHRSVVEIKTVGGVPLAHELEQVMGDDIKPLPDDGYVVLKGGEQFISHPKDSGSS
jgi:predicted Rdx family selenoprotein